MKLTDKQAHILLHLLEDSLKMNIVGLFSIDMEHRNQLLNEILNQQSDELIDLSEPPEPT